MKKYLLSTVLVVALLGTLFTVSQFGDAASRDTYTASVKDVGFDPPQAVVGMDVVFDFPDLELSDLTNEQGIAEVTYSGTPGSLIVTIQYEGTIYYPVNPPSGQYRSTTHTHHFPFTVDQTP